MRRAQTAWRARERLPCCAYGMEENNPLYWEASYEIVLSLMKHHPDADLDTLGLQQLFEWIIALPGFADEPILANDQLLIEILREWYEEQSEAL